MTLALLAHDDAYDRYVARVPIGGQVQGPYLGTFEEVHAHVCGLLDAAYGMGSWQLVYEDHPWQFVAAGEAVSRSGPLVPASVSVGADGIWHGRVPGAPFFREESFPALQRAVERVTGAVGARGSLSYKIVEFEHLPYE